MGVWKLVSGILNIVLAAFIVFQSSMAGLSNALEENGESGGSAGLMVAILLLVAGIVSIVMRNRSGKANLPLAILYLLAALIGFGLAGSYSDLKIWAGWCAICGVLALLAMRNKKEQ